jgi:hypothetical protein
MPTPERLQELHQQIMGETIKSERSGISPAPFSIMQPLYAERNTEGVDLSRTVYRLLPLEYLCDDITRAVLTMANIEPAMWKDSYENPLKDATFPDTVTGGVISIHDLMKSHYGTCWTYQPESLNAWQTFGNTPTSVRIETTVGKLLAALMQQNDHYYMLHFYAGLVTYRPIPELANWKTIVKLTEILDSEGLALAASLSVVRDGYSGEKEVRVIYSHQSNDPWAQANVSLSNHPSAVNGLVHVPCTWRDLIASITVRSNIPATAQADLVKILTGYGISCTVRTSSMV